MPVMSQGSLDSYPMLVLARLRQWEQWPGNRAYLHSTSLQPSLLVGNISFLV